MGKTDADESRGLLLPIAVFLDTNVLDSLPESLESGELSNLVDQERRVFVPDVVAREWISHRHEKAISSIRDALKASQHLRQYSDKWINIGLKELRDQYGNIMRKSVKRLRGTGLRVLRPPRLDTRDITARATRKIPPFKDGGRGFKDEMVLLSMLDLLSRGNLSQPYLSLATRISAKP